MEEVSIVSLSKEQLLENEIRDHKRCEVINEILARHPEGFQVKNLLLEHPKLFENNSQAFRFLIELRDYDKIVCERRGDQYFYTEKVDAYKVLNELWQKSA